MKKRLLCLAVFIVISLSVLVCSACKPIHPTPGWDQLYELKIADKDSLKIIFGSQYLYPDTEEYNDISVGSKHGDTLYYKKHLVEYMPELTGANWTTKVDGVEFRFVIGKKEKDIPLKEPEAPFKDLDKTKVIGELSVFYKSGTTISENELENRYISCLFYDARITYFISVGTTTLTETEISEIAFELIGNMKRG